MIDHGPADYDPLYDYPSFCINAALGVKRDREAVYRIQNMHTLPDEKLSSSRQVMGGMYSPS